MVINAGHEDKDIPHMKAHLADFVAKGGDASLEMLPDNGILALQGPKAAAVLQSLAPQAPPCSPCMQELSLKSSASRA